MRAEDLSPQARFRGALLGLACGDAVGTAVEFRPPGSFTPLTDMVGGGPLGLPAGAWTDDTAMALCLAESLVETGGFDTRDQLSRYLRWYREGHLSSTGSCVDIGGATRAALLRFERTGEPYPGDADPQAGGNGSLMRLAPVALAYAGEPAAALARAAESARVTHGAPQAIDATRYLAGLLVGAVRGAGREALLGSVYTPVDGASAHAPLHPEVAAVAAGSFREREPPSIRGGGYAVHALEAALWAVHGTDSYAAAVLAAANLGDDADTTAAIAGQLAGALYGVEAIPERWRARLALRERIEELADGLLALAAALAGADDAPGDAYWAVPGAVLAGPYPGAPDDRAARARLAALLDAGVTRFLDLTEAGEGPPLRPYDGLLAALAAERGVPATHRRMAVPDLGVPNIALMRAILGELAAARAAGELTYLHCWGGIGRTGTAVGCLLVEEGHDPASALRQIAHLRRDGRRAGRRSPETDAQRAFVAAWATAGGDGPTSP